jgi:type IV pilus assembly protein PilE
MKRSTRNGFTLLEVLITIVVVAVLGAVALPSFMEQIRKARRSDAIESLTAVQQAQEKWRATNLTYESSLATLGFTGSPVYSKDQYYTIALSGTSGTGYTVTATPVTGKSQASDSGCTSITLVIATGSITQNPVKCWNR